MSIFHVNPPGIHAEAEETEEFCVGQIVTVDSKASWVIGEYASKLHRHYGWTDERIGAVTGLCKQRINEKRRTWEAYPPQVRLTGLSFTHYEVSLPWDDAAECLQWAEEMEATVAEMKAWRRAQHGEDLSQAAYEDEDTFSPAPLNAQPSTLNELKDDPVAVGTTPGKTPQPVSLDEATSGGPARPAAKVTREPTTLDPQPPALDQQPYQPGNIEQLLDGIEAILERLDRETRLAYAARLRDMIKRLEQGLT